MTIAEAETEGKGYKENMERTETWQTGMDRSYLEIDTDNLVHNARVLQKAMQPGCELMAVVKAQAYGHGAYVVASCLNRAGIKAFAAATVDEGIKLRKEGIEGEILILGYTDVRRAAELKACDLTQTLIDYAYAEALNQRGVTVKVHVKIDTGMHRLGIPCENTGEIKAVFGMKHLKVCGMFTHLGCASGQTETDILFTNKQIERFYRVTDVLLAAGICLPKLHIQSSYGLLNYPKLRCDYVRAGIALYGVLSGAQDETKQKLALRPVLSLKSKVILIRHVKKGEYAGYDRGFLAERDSRIGILPVGYADGYPRNLSGGRGRVRIGKTVVPVVGNVCMDQLLVDLTEALEVRTGDTAVLIDGETDGNGPEGSRLSAPFVAAQAGTISNELLCRMGPRLPVVVSSMNCQ